MVLTREKLHQTLCYRKGLGMQNKNIKEQLSCRVCAGELKTVLDLGSIYPSAFIPIDTRLNEDVKAPLELAECESCGLIQLKHTIDLDLMYRQYWYSSSLNKSMVTSLKDVVSDVLSKVQLNDEDTVIDIGANDCTMLGMYPNKNLETVGFEPALNIRPIHDSVIVWIPDYFSKEAYEIYTTHPNHPEWKNKKAKVITAIAMFYDLPDPVKFAKDVASILADDGIFVVQFTDLISMFKATAFDNICHEHLEYYRLVDVKNILELAGLELIDVSYNDVNGGSLRVTAAHKGARPVLPSVQSSLDSETEYLAKHSFSDFTKKIDTLRMKTTHFLKWAKEKGDTVHLLGASTKGNTLLQVLGITNDFVAFAAEVNSDKFGLKTAGSDIPIISETDSLVKHPDYYFVPVWHFKASILRNPKMYDYLKSGGSLVFPLPEFVFVTLDYDNNIKETRI